MLDGAVRVGASAAVGLATYAQVADQTVGRLEPLGLAGIAATLVYWMVARLTRQLDEQTASLREVAEELRRVARYHEERHGGGE